MSATAAASEISRLRAQLERLQGRRIRVPVLPVPPALAEVLPDGGLRPGAAYAVDGSTSLLLALLAGPSKEGAWCGAVGVPELGAEAAAAMGVELSRLVLVPDPGPRWQAVTATVIEVLQVVAVRPGGRASAGEVARLSARLRERGGVLLVQGEWPQAEATLAVRDASWSGLGDGDGYLHRRALTVQVTARRRPHPRLARMLLPDERGAMTSIARAAPPASPLRAVS